MARIKNQKPAVKKKKSSVPKKIEAQKAPVKQPTKNSSKSSVKKPTKLLSKKTYRKTKKNVYHFAKNNRVSKKISAKVQENRRINPHRTLRLTRRSEVRRYDSIPSFHILVARAFSLLVRNWKKTLVLLAIFSPLAWISTGFFSQNFTEIKTLVNIFDDSELTLLEESGMLVSSFFTAQVTDLPQDALITLNILAIFLWLSFVWVARHSFANKETTAKEALYTSGAAFIPFLILLILLVLQLLPAIFAVIIFLSTQGGGFTQTTMETSLFVALGILLVIFSLYFIINTIIAMKVVTLPGMHPWRALRNSKRLVMNRRFSVLRKILILPIVLALGWIILFVPMLLLDNYICDEGQCWTTLTILPLTYYLLIGASIAFSSVYLYTIYRALLEQEDEYV